MSWRRRGRGEPLDAFAFVFWNFLCALHVHADPEDWPMMVFPRDGVRSMNDRFEVISAKQYTSYLVMNVLGV